MRTAKRKSFGHRDALGKAVQVLSWIVNASDGVEDKKSGLRELCRALNMPAATTHRVLTGLGKLELLQHDPNSGRYYLGPEMYRIALKVQSCFAIRNAGIPVMEDLVAQCNEAAFLGFYNPIRMEMMFVALVNSSHALRYVVPINVWIPVYAGASGLAIMAFLPKKDRQTIVKRTRLSPITPRTITDPVQLEEELAWVRAHGYAVSVGQRTEGAIAIAAPIWNPSGHVMGELNLSIPESRYDAAMEPKFARLVIQHAGRIMEKLGARPPSEYQPKIQSR